MLYKLHTAWTWNNFSEDLKGLYLLRCRFRKWRLKWVKKIMWSTFTGRAVWQNSSWRTPLEIFMDERKHVHLVANQLGKALCLLFILQIFWDFDFEHVFLWWIIYQCEPLTNITDSAWIKHNQVKSWENSGHLSCPTCVANCSSSDNRSLLFLLFQTLCDFRPRSAWVTAQ